MIYCSFLDFFLVFGNITILTAYVYFKNSIHCNYIKITFVDDNFYRSKLFEIMNNASSFFLINASKAINNNNGTKGLPVLEKR